MRRWPVLFGLLLVFPLAAQETEIVYLSGRGAGSEVPWEFRFAAGRGSGGWTTIKVPGHWEQQGFGTYNYGHDEEKGEDVGFYRHHFEVPEAWRGRRVDLVFEGAMTDTVATVNGKAAGPRHQGGFTRFSYDVTALLRYGAANRLEVEVHETSADDSVEEAERLADYWVFGGIYRPVYLAVSPLESIAYWPIDARADGAFRAPVRLRGLAAPADLELRIETLDGRPVGAPLSARTGEGSAAEAAAELTGRFAGVAAWNAEEPHLYRAILELRRGGEVLHRSSKKFGFRTFEVRGGDDPAPGLYVNGRRILLKGVNRHVFFPDTGRTSNAERDRADAELIKSLNLNAVRASHYPPDVAFLDACDELGLYVIDELPGWHEAYDTAPGRILVRETVERDADHPSILMWANGNEGGHNFDLVADFAKHDPQARPVIHPKGVLSGIDAWHYPTWSELQARLEPRSPRGRWRGLFGALPLHLPTEFQHGLYDGGGGASLEDYWRAIRASPLGAGGFLWSFTDEAIERSDGGGRLDSAGNYGPDGILGPWRESSGSSAAVAEVFAPVAWIAPLEGADGLAGWDGRLLLENRNDFLDLARFRLDWRTLAWPRGREAPALATGSLPLPAAAPGGRAEVDLGHLPWRQADGLELRVVSPEGRVVAQRVLAVRPQDLETRGLLGAASEAPRLERRGELLFLREGALAVELDAATGALRAFHSGATRLPLAAPMPTARARDGKDPALPESVRLVDDGRAVGVDLRYADPEALFSWRLLGRGHVRFSYLARAGGGELPGVFFPLAAERLEAFSFLGKGPARVWRNRLAGLLGFHRKVKAESAAPAFGQEPIFEGSYGPLRRAELELAEGTLELLFEQPVFLGILSPRFPEDAQDATATVLPRDGISFLVEPGAIGTKFDTAGEMGPAAAAKPYSGLFSGVVWLSFKGGQ